MLLKQNNPTRLILAVFAVFFSVALLIYASGKRMHERPGEGLSPNLAHEFLAQYYVRIHDNLKLDVKLEVPAARAKFDEANQIRFRVRNLAEAALDFKMKITPSAESISSMKLDFDSNKVYRLKPGEDLSESIPYTLSSSGLQSRDGTVDFEISVSAP